MLHRNSKAILLELEIDHMGALEIGIVFEGDMDMGALMILGGDLIVSLQIVCIKILRKGRLDTNKVDIREGKSQHPGNNKGVINPKENLQAENSLRHNHREQGHKRRMQHVGRHWEEHLKEDGDPII